MNFDIEIQGHPVLSTMITAVLKVSFLGICAYTVGKNFEAGRLRANPSLGHPAHVNVNLGSQQAQD